LTPFRVTTRVTRYGGAGPSSELGSPAVTPRSAEAKGSAIEEGGTVAVLAEQQEAGDLAVLAEEVGD
jgi:hypothetical protein